MDGSKTYSFNLFMMGESLVLVVDSEFTPLHIFTYR